MTDLVPRLIKSKQQDDDRIPTVTLPLSVDTVDVEDRELMMHWCTTTYRSMARGPTTESLWQTAIPQLSLRHPALRHGLLALSALQLVGITTNSSRKMRLWKYACEHQSQALEGIQFEETRELTTPQCNASSALCWLLLAFSFAYSKIGGDIQENDGNQSDPLDNFLELFELMRWLVSTRMLIVDRVALGELYTLVQRGTILPTMPDTSQLVIAALRRQNDIEANRNSDHEKDVYDQAIDHLRCLLAQLINGGEPKDFAFSWAFRTPIRYQDLLRERESFALVLLAHYAVILHHMRDTWWVGDWGLRILQEINRQLESQYRHLMSWPIDATGGYSLIE